jgi:uncharacterized protein
MPVRRRPTGILEIVSPIHRPARRSGSFTRFGPDDPDVRGAFPHVSPRVLKAAHASWSALASVIHPPGRRWVGRLINRADLPRIDVPVAGLHPAFDGYTIAFLSDIHAGPYLGADVLSPLFTRVKKERPDLVVLGGDLVNYDADEAEEVVAAMKHLDSKDGILSVPGNHDHYSGDLPRVIRMLEKAGAQTLLNDATSITRRGEPLAILGVDDGGAGSFDLARALERSPAAATRILLSHTPDALPLAARAGIDLVVSGHTHGGQLRAPKVRPLSTHTKGRYVDGFYRRGDTTAFVGRGVGVVCFPLRVFCPPHVPLLVLRSRPRDASTPRGENGV